jgi:hypothetical protein
MQNTNHILMIRPVRFSFNEQTAESNAFQHATEKADDTQHKALDEFTHMVEILDENGVSVYVVDDTLEPHKPDSIFPNNWISFHENGTVGLYPMQAENRRLERRADILELLTTHFTIDDIIDLTQAEKENKFLEGTGSMVLDRENKICYACLSPRTNEKLVDEFCKQFSYKKIIFTARDTSSMLIYHTNVVMCVGEKFMVICMESIHDLDEKNAIKNSTQKEIIEISLEQLHHFAGNMLEVKNKDGEHLLVMSDQAYSSLLPEQIFKLGKYARIIPIPLYTIEANGGGSARCMMAEIFLPEKNNMRN